nr:MAG TPA: hypothetical protein [Caudoviricetes sp.]
MKQIYNYILYLCIGKFPIHGMVLILLFYLFDYRRKQYV